MTRPAWLLLLASTLALSGSAPRALASAAAGDPGWRVSADPFALSFTAGSTTVLTSATGAPGPGTRLSYLLADGTAHTVTALRSSAAVPGGAVYTVATDEPARTATVAVTHESEGTRVAFTLSPSADVEEVYWAGRSPSPTEHFVGTGIQHQRLDLRGELVQLKVAYPCGRSIVAPYFASSAGYGVYFDTDESGQIQFQGSHDGMPCGTPNELHPLCRVRSAPDLVQACFRGSSLTYHVLLGTPSATVAAFRRLAGRAPAPPLAAFGAIKWRDRVASSADVLSDVTHFRDLRIPLGAVLVDNPWERGGCLGSLQFDATRIAHPSSLIDQVHAAGVRFDVWVSPRVEQGAGCPASGYDSGELLRPPTDEDYDIVDFTNARARGTFESKIAALTRLGVDGFKADRGDESDKEGLSFDAGSSALEHNLYPSRFAAAVVAGSKGAGSNRFVMLRGANRHTPSTSAAVWAGDQTPDFAGLADAIHSLASLGASGYSLAGSDVGGYSSGSSRLTLTAAALARWAQLGAISPVFELGGADRAATFWKLGPAAVAAVRAGVTLHYELIPLFAQLAAASARTGAPILQPVASVWPKDERAWSHDLELLVGTDLLAAPVATATTRPRVYLPPGSWVDLYAGRTVTGGRVVARRTLLDEFPLYLRTAKTIPFDLRLDLWPKAWPLNALRVPGRAGWLTTGHSMTMTGAPRESEVLFAGARATRVAVGGRSVPRAATVAALRRMRTGWTTVRAPFPGVLVKVAPANGRFSVRVS